MRILLLYWLVACLVCFAAMGIDKIKARTHKWRISERTLFLLAILGGAVGGCLGMALFRHKTRHPFFQWGFPVLAVVQTAAIILVWKTGILA